MIEITFQPWRPFIARKKPDTIRKWLRGIGEASKQAFTGGMGGSPPSSPGEYPAVRTGRLKGSVSFTTTSDSVTIGSNMPYSIYLRMGTYKMARRKMSDNALKEGVEKAGRLKKWVEWTRI
jgi:phage gpG-like protein